MAPSPLERVGVRSNIFLTEGNLLPGLTNYSIGKTVYENYIMNNSFVY